jgi:hypothetical protein
MQVRLKLPKGIRFPKDDEFPKSYDRDQLRAEFENAPIFPGYVIKKPEDRQPFSFFAECNVHATDLWPFIVKVAALLPDDVKAIVGERDENPFISSPSKKSKVIKAFEPFSFELTNDPFLEFGIRSLITDPVCEIFVKYAKYVQFWGNDLNQFSRLMNELGLSEHSNLRFVDEFPLVSEPPPAPAKSAISVIEGIKGKLEPSGVFSRIKKLLS